MYYLCTAYEQRIELWCNGNTADFGSVVLGSSPGSSTHKRLLKGSLFFLCNVHKVDKMLISATSDIPPIIIGKCNFVA